MTIGKLSKLEQGSQPLLVIVGHFDPIVRPGLEEVLCSAGDLEIVGSDLEKGSLERTVAVSEAAIVILSQGASHAMIGRLKAGRPLLGVVVVAHDPSPSYGWQLLALGASCVAQNAPVPEFLDAIRMTGRGGRVFLDARGERVARLPSAALSQLTPTERRVLVRLSRDDQYAAIAHDLEMSIETVRKHAAQIRRKLGVGSRRDLVGIPLSD